MKKVCTFLLMTAVAVSFAACGGSAENKPANTANANTAKPAPAAPTADALLALEKQANEAYTKGDSKYFESFLSDKFSMAGMKGERMDKAAVIKMIGGVKCDVKSWDLTDPQMSKIDNDTYAFSYKATWDGTCNDGPGGKTMKIPSPVRGASVFVRSGDKWLGAWHGETMIIEPKGDAKKDEAKKDDVKKDEAKNAELRADVSKDVVEKEAAKKEEAKKAEPKKEEAKKEDAKKDDKAATSSAPAEAPKPDANTEALVKIHTSGWEAWKAKDAKKLGEITMANLSIVDPTGMWMSGKDAVLKHWTETMKCEGINNVKVSDGFASAISPTVELLTLKGTADGSCGGQKNGPLYQAAVYVKEADAWKLAFMFESPAM